MSCPATDTDNSKIDSVTAADEIELQTSDLRSTPCQFHGRILQGRRRILSDQEARKAEEPQRRHTSQTVMLGRRKALIL